MSVLEVRNLKKSFDKDTVVLKGVDFSLEKGETVAIIGSSGSGKTTLLRCLNFLTVPDEGQIVVNGKTLFDDADPNTQKEREIRRKRLHFGLVFQNFNLFPQYTARQNVMLASELLAKEQPDYKTRKKQVHAQIAARAEELLTQVGLKEKMDLYPHQLSGGQQQRVAIARALVNRPKVLLLDEPLGALDLRLRKDMQIELKRIQQQMGITFVYVTHDQEEALTMSDTVVVMDKGRIQQIGTPEDIYNEPKNAFVADFIGESNIIDGIMIRDELVSILGQKFPCVDKGFGTNKPVDVVIRPEDVEITEPGAGFMDGDIVSIIFKGVHYEISIMANGYEWLVHTTKMYPVGTHVGINVIPFNIQIMNKPESEDEEAVEIDA